MCIANTEGMSENHFLKQHSEQKQAATCPHSVGGPQKTSSLNGNRYYIIFIDDYMRFCWINVFKYKSEVASVI